MINKLRKIDLKKAGIAVATVGIINVFLHIFVLFKILPYTWVNGGRTETYEAACQISSMSIIITVISILIMLVASNIIKLKLNKFWTKVLFVLLVINISFSFIGVIQQFLGTTFEICFTSILTIILFIANLRIAIEKRW